MITVAKKSKGPSGPITVYIEDRIRLRELDLQQSMEEEQTRVLIPTLQARPPQRKRHDLEEKKKPTLKQTRPPRWIRRREEKVKKKKQTELGSKLLGPPIRRNILPGLDPVEVFDKLAASVSRNCNNQWLVIHSHPAGVVWAMNQWQLWLPIWLKHASVGASVFVAGKRIPVDLAQQPMTAGIHVNTGNPHCHSAHGLLIKINGRTYVVDLNGGLDHILAQFATQETLRELAMVPEHTPRLYVYNAKTKRVEVDPVVQAKIPGELFRAAFPDGPGDWTREELEKRLQQHAMTIKAGKGQKLVLIAADKECNMAAVDARWTRDGLEEQFGLAPGWRFVGALPPLPPHPAVYHRARRHPGEIFRAAFPDGLVSLTRKELEAKLKMENMAILRGAKGGLVVVAGRESMAMAPVDPRWSRQEVEELYALQPDWQCLGLPPKEQSLMLGRPETTKLVATSPPAAMDRAFTQFLSEFLEQWRERMLRERPDYADVLARTQARGKLMWDEYDVEFSTLDGKVHRLGRMDRGAVTAMADRYLESSFTGMLRHDEKIKGADDELPDLPWGTLRLRPVLEPGEMLLAFEGVPARNHDGLASNDYIHELANRYGACIVQSNRYQDREEFTVVMMLYVHPEQRERGINARQVVAEKWAAELGARAYSDGFHMPDVIHMTKEREVRSCNDLWTLPRTMYRNPVLSAPGQRMLRDADATVAVAQAEWWDGVNARRAEQHGIPHPVVAEALTPMVREPLFAPTARTLTIASRMAEDPDEIMPARHTVTPPTQVYSAEEDEEWQKRLAEMRADMEKEATARHQAPER